jgi:hypothetical protein
MEARVTAVSGGNAASRHPVGGLPITREAPGQTRGFTVKHDQRAKGKALLDPRRCGLRPG